MSHGKRNSKRKGRTKAITVLGVAGALSLAGGASEAAVGPADDTPTENTAPVITLGEEEISDVSLTTFYVFDNENVGAHRPGLQLARGRGHGGCAVRRGYTGCAVTCGGCGGGRRPRRPRRRRAGWSVGRYQRPQPQVLGSLLCDACPRETRFCAVETASREISVCTRLRGGAGRTRTSNQTIISRQL